MKTNKDKMIQTHSSAGIAQNPMLPAVVGSQTKYQIVYADPAWDFGKNV